MSKEFLSSEEFLNLLPRPFNPLGIVSESDELLKVSYSLGFLALFFIGISPVVIGLSQFGVKLDGLVAVGDGQVPLSLVAVGCCPVQVGLSQFGVKFDCLVAVSYS